MSFLLGKFGAFLPCHNELWIVNASMVTVRCFVWICEKHLPPELYLQSRESVSHVLRMRWVSPHLLEEPVEHVLIHLTRSRAVQLHDLLRFRVVAVQRPELTASVAEQHQEVLRLRASDLLQHLLLRVTIDDAREYAVLDRVQDDASIGLGRGLFIQFRSYVRE